MRYDSIYSTIAKGRGFEVFYDNKTNYYLLFIEGKFTKKYKLKNNLYKYVYNRYNVSLMF